jgi:hypothetical protein
MLLPFHARALLVEWEISFRKHRRVGHEEAVHADDEEQDNREDFKDGNNGFTFLGRGSSPKL